MNCLLNDHFETSRGRPALLPASVSIGVHRWFLFLLAASCSGGIDLAGDATGDETAVETADAPDAPDVIVDAVDGAVDDGTSTDDATGDEGGGGAECEAQIAAGRICDGGGCVESQGTFWDGRECFETFGCECAGADCGRPFASLAECEAAHATCDAALCLASGGSWFPASAGYCGFSCGVPDACITEAPLDSCDCGPGARFHPGEGCAVEVAGCAAEALCRDSDGTWHGDPECRCPFQCGEELPECYACGETCDCGPFRSFDGDRGCVPDAGCPGADRRTACETTGGTWHDCSPGDGGCSCGDYFCGAPNRLDPCVMPGCDCGPSRNFADDVGCRPDDACVLRTEGQDCSGWAGASTCRPGLVCCEHCGAPPGCPSCQPPCCEDDPMCMTDGCPVPPP